MAKNNPDPKAVLAIVLGVSECPNHDGLDSIPNCANSAREFSRYLTSLEFGIPADQVLACIDNDTSASLQMEEMAQWLSARKEDMHSRGVFATDLIFYYSGHGSFTAGDRAYYLATRRTKNGLEGSTSIRFVDLLQLLKNYAKDLRRYLILDCCFAAAGVKLQTAGATIRRVVRTQEEQMPAAGTAMLCSSSSGDVAVALDAEKLTMFSGALLKALQLGNRNHNEKRTLSDLGSQVEEIIRTSYQDKGVRPELHVPEQTKGNIAEQVRLFPNATAIPISLRARKPIASVIAELREMETALPEYVAVKLRRMKGDAYSFFQSTSGLFYREGFPTCDAVDQAPFTWISGDLLVESFAAYFGDNGEVVFDLADFDEALMGPSSWDLLRFVTGIHVAAISEFIDKPLARKMCNEFIIAYCAEMALDKPRYVNRSSTKSSSVSQILTDRRFGRAADLNTGTSNVYDGHRLSGGLISRVDGELRLRMTKMLESINDGLIEEIHVEGFEKLLSGIGSVGIERYAALVEVKYKQTSSTKRMILEIKRATESSLWSVLSNFQSQPVWADEATRSVSIQHRCQATPPAILFSGRCNDKGYVIRQYGGFARCYISPPSVTAKKDKEWVELAAEMGKVTAWNHLRGADWKGGASREELSAFSKPLVLLPLAELAQNTLAPRAVDHFKVFMSGVGGTVRNADRVKSIIASLNEADAVAPPRANSKRAKREAARK